VDRYPPRPDVLLATKLHVPRAQPGLVSRPRLASRLDAGLDHGLVLIAAPAGYGKSVLLSEWARARAQPVAWLSLDGRDNDPVRFWRHVLAALDTVRPGVAERVGPLAGPPPPPAYNTLVTARCRHHGMAFALGFRSSATVFGWLGAIGIVVATAFAAAWLTVALGMAAKTPESAGLAVVPLILLPFVSSAVVPAAKMGLGVRQFAQYQPFTPIIESLRGLLAGTPSAGYTAAALAWCTGIALVGYLWSRATFSRRA
jgi:hypothetical protein